MGRLQFYNGRVIVWIDGACFGNHHYGDRSAGYGVWFNHNHRWNDWGSITDVDATNNNAEIESAIRAINICANHGRRYIQIRTDSDFLIKSVTQYLPKWKQRNWRRLNGSPLKNIVKFQELDEAINDEDMDIEWIKVEAHQGIIGNEKADELARRGAGED